MGSAFNTLGFKAAHYREDLLEYWVKKDYAPIIAEITKHDAFHDAPWNLMNMLEVYMDEFPDSKFILTVRDEHHWIQSVKNYFYDVKSKCSHIRHSDDSYIIERNQYLFGSTYLIDEDNCLNKYREFNEYVYQIIPKDKLLIMNLEHGDGWDELCQFLERPVPDCPFPHKHTSSEVMQKKIRAARTA